MITDFTIMAIAPSVAVSYTHLWIKTLSSNSALLSVPCSLIPVPCFSVTLTPVMPHALAQSIEIFTAILAVAGMGYFLAALIAARLFLNARQAPLPAFAPGVSICLLYTSRCV